MLTPNLMKIRPMEALLFHADRRTYLVHDGADSSFLQFWGTHVQTEILRGYCNELEYVN
jgi:hypothetical protein